jgi:DnaJ-class molecular chaperone
MAFEIGKLTGRLRNLQERRRKLQSDYERELAEIDAQIKDEQAALQRINEVLEPYICKQCGGTGQDSFMDAAGSRDWRTCKHCRGTGISAE